MRLCSTQSAWLSSQALECTRLHLGSGQPVGQPFCRLYVLGGDRPALPQGVLSLLGWQVYKENESVDRLSVTRCVKQPLYSFAMFC